MTGERSEEGTEEATEEATETETEPLNKTTSVVLELDEVFAGLEHPRRRYLMYTLINGSNEAPLPELAACIAAWEQDKSVSEVTDEKQQDVYISLYHCHIPKLSRLGIVNYRVKENIIVRAVNTDQVQAVLDGAGAELDTRQETHARDTDNGGSDK